MARSNPVIDALTREADFLRKQLEERRKDPGDLGVAGCGDHSCCIQRVTGMATNGGCRCDAHKLRQAVRYYKRLAAFREETIRDMRAGLVETPDPDAAKGGSNG